MTPQERSKLFSDLLNQDIDEADLLRLEAELIVDGDVRREYYQHVQLDWLLRDLAEGETKLAEGETGSQQSTSLIPASTPASWAWRMSSPWALAVMAATLIFTVTAVGWGLTSLTSNTLTSNTAASSGAPTSEAEETVATGFAVLSGQSEAVWETASMRSGQLIPAGQHHLVSGMAHVELFSGVEMVVQGDAVFAIDSPMQVRLTRGRVRTRVPEPARGFRIKTDDGDIVDLGTEFSVDVRPGRAQLRVVEGEVEWHGGSAVQTLVTGDQKRLDKDGSAIKDPDASLEMVGPLEFTSVRNDIREQQLARWIALRQSLHEDGTLVAHYDMSSSDPASRQIDNLARGYQHHDDGLALASRGAIVAAQPIDDRWGRADGALDFSRIGSRIRVDVPGEFRDLTLVTWVKINGLDRLYNSLFLTDGYQVGEPHWQITRDGRLFFSLMHALDGSDEKFQSNSRQERYHSPPFWDASRSGRWTMLGLVYDSQSRRVTHYVDGQAVHRDMIAEDVPDAVMRIGSSSICNWSEPMYRQDPDFVLRNLNGGMDEFMMFTRAMPDDEIKTLFETGTPHEF